MSRTPILASLLVLFLTGAARAQTVTGRVVDAAGMGVAGIDIDLDNLGSGGDPNLSGDYTDAAGFFSLTSDAAGVFDVVFHPPRPPATTHLVKRLHDRAIVGAVDLGTIVLTPGVSISGQVVDANGLPVGGLDFDVSGANGADVELAGGATDVGGNFLFAVPLGAIGLELDASSILFPTYAPRELALTLAANTNLGVLTLQPGLRISGVASVNGAAVTGADIDVHDSATHASVFLQNDNTSATGAFSVVVPAGTYDVSVCPKPGDLIVAHEAADVVVAANTNLGALALEPGVFLTGTVRDCAGNPAAGADVQVDRTSGAPVALCRDDTDATGHYAVVVPIDVLDVGFRHPTLGNDAIAGVLVNGPTVLDGELSPVAATVRNGSGVNPLRYANLTLPVLGATWTTQVDCTGFPAGLAVQIGRTLPTTGAVGPFGQELIRGPKLFTFTRAHGGGTATFAHALPNLVALCGLPASTQVLITAGGAGSPVLTNAIDVVLGH